MTKEPKAEVTWADVKVHWKKEWAEGTPGDWAFIVVVPAGIIAILTLGIYAITGPHTCEQAKANLKTKQQEHDERLSDVTYPQGALNGSYLYLQDAKFKAFDLCPDMGS